MANTGKLRWLFISCVFVLITIYFLTSFLLFNFSNDFSTMRNLPKRLSDLEISRRRMMAVKKNGFPVLKVSQAGEHKDYRIKFNHTLNKTGIEFWRSIIPKYECPFVLLEKIGGMAKGQQKAGKKKRILDWGKWTCGVKSLFGKESTSPCVMMSFGVDYDTRSDYTFEMEVVKKWNCSIYLFGHSEIKNLGPFISNSSDLMDHFNYKFGLDGRENGTTDKNKLKNLILEVKNETGSVNMLKVVVAGDAAYQQLDQLFMGNISKRTAPVMSTISQLFLEFHVRDWGNLSVKEGDTGESERVVAVLKKLENMGFRLFQKNLIKNPEYKGCCREFSFINLQTLFKS